MDVINIEKPVNPASPEEYRPFELAQTILPQRLETKGIARYIEQ